MHNDRRRRRQPNHRCELTDNIMRPNEAKRRRCEVARFQTPSSSAPFVGGGRVDSPLPFFVVLAIVILTLSALVDGASAVLTSPLISLPIAVDQNGADGSVGARFGPPQLGSPPDPCYDENDRARRCIPTFVNAAFGRPVIASSTCGNSVTQLPASLAQALGHDRPATAGSSRRSKCRRDRKRSDGTSGPRRRWDCDRRSDADDDELVATCDSSDPAKWHPASFLTDLNNPSNRTCWISAPVREDGADNGGIVDEGPAGKAQSVDVSETGDEVSLTLSLGKKYEVNMDVVS